ncbi:MAG: cytochrome c maturation protein CcmE [Actinomycetia bacterium]|nr:cytochrome c maturation protein CcmE [Actinomycetes bacterium]MCP4224631.1 cytochrome c maturation protein CcmE [Actinomycetes bacterium]MCP5034679.1 cytochrome c maturation protein CcmE [Actinomycetes bacterium]
MTDLDLSPRGPADEGSSSSPRKRSIRNIAVMSILVLVLGFVLFQAITSARVFFLNVDEAVEQRAELGDRNFRMQGTVVSEDGVDDIGALLFDVSFNGETVSVRHTGDEPSSLFAIGEKVVVEGHWQGQVFRSHQILVKHSEEYIEENPDRLDYELESDATGE